MAKSKTATSPVVASLHGVLVDTYALAVKTHGAHWNVTGAGFFQLHAAFNAQYDALFLAADEIAERIRAIGAPAPNGIKALAGATGVSDIGTTEGAALAKDLASDHRTLSAACAKGVKVAQDAGDEATADLFIKQVEEHDKTAWMLESVSG
jgi:starvation-inducible DNA-binding protein